MKLTLDHTKRLNLHALLGAQRAAEVTRIKTTIENWAQYGAAVDRQWLEPLVQSLFCL